MRLTNDPVPRPAPPDPRLVGVPGPLRTLKGSVALEWVRDRLARGAPRAYNALARLRLWEPLGGDTVGKGEQLRVYKRRRGQPEIESWTLTADLQTLAASPRQRSISRRRVRPEPDGGERSDGADEVSYGLDESAGPRPSVARSRRSEVGAFPALDSRRPARGDGRRVGSVPSLRRPLNAPAIARPPTPSPVSCVPGWGSCAPAIDG